MNDHVKVLAYYQTTRRGYPLILQEQIPDDVDAEEMRKSALAKCPADVMVLLVPSPPPRGMKDALALLHSDIDVSPDTGCGVVSSATDLGKRLRIR